MIDEAERRWWCVEAQLASGDRPVFVGRLEATAAEITANLGPCVTIEPNGRVLVWGPPRPPKETRDAQMDLPGTDQPRLVAG